jgi:hypothetical protein
MAVNKQDIYWLINSLEDAKVVLWPQHQSTNYETLTTG